MKNIKILSYLFIVALFFTACQKEEPQLGSLPGKADIKFTVTQDKTIDPGGNTIIMINQTPGIVPIWDYGTGRSNRATDTIHVAFKGDYIIRFSALTGAGIVKLDSVVVTVTQDELKYVNDPLWTLLSGGIGHSKTWILDNGKYGLATAPLSFADPSVTQVWGNFTPNYEPADVGQTANDLAAEMTFSLMGGPYMNTVKPNENTGNENGTYFLDAENHTLSTTNATIIRPAIFIPRVSNWTSNLRVLLLTENQLRVLVYRDYSGEQPWYLILNYVSKEYAKNYVPKFVPDPNFTFGNQLTMLAGGSAQTWKMDTNTPFNWTDLTGKFLNEWNTITDYAGWTGYNSAAVANIDNVRFTFYKTGDFELTLDDGTVQRGTFSIDEPKNMITFEGARPNINIVGWVNATTTTLSKDDAGNVITGENQWKIIKRKTISGVTTEVWFGKRDPAKKEYMVYHFDLATGVPNVMNEMIKGLAGKATGTSSRTFKIDLNHPVDWTNLEGVGNTVAGVQDENYWNDEIAASVKNQTITFTQTDGVLSMSKKDAQGNVTTSPVTIDPATRRIIIPGTDIIKFGGGSTLPTAGPDYYWVAGEFNEVATQGFWIGVKSKPDEFTAYHYILK